MTTVTDQEHRTVRAGMLKLSEDNPAVVDVSHDPSLAIDERDLVGNGRYESVVGDEWVLVGIGYTAIGRTYARIKAITGLLADGETWNTPLGRFYEMFKRPERDRFTERRRKQRDDFERDGTRYFW